MNKQLIARTAVCYLSSEYNEYIVESPLLDGCSGIGETEDEAHRLFSNLLDDAYEAYLEGRVPEYDKPGRPSKGRVALNTDVLPDTRKGVKSLAQELNCSQGEILDFLYAFHIASLETTKAQSEMSTEDEEGLITATVTLTKSQAKQLVKNLNTSKPKVQKAKPLRRRSRSA